MAEYLFSYGTLQLEKIQLESFGRILNGTKDRLKGYKLISIEIKDAAVLKQSKLQFHPIAIPSDTIKDSIEGSVFEITNEELLQADNYEVEDYKRILAILESGKKPGFIFLFNTFDLGNNNYTIAPGNSLNRC